MATNSNLSSASTSQTTGPSTSTKRKAPARKVSMTGAGAVPKSAARKTSVSSKNESKEILFKDEPRAHLQPVPPYIWIDHPQQGELLHASHYALRLGVGGAEEVQVSFDKSGWQSCRFTVGFWWYDLHNLSRGKHTVVGRMRTAGGQWYRTPPRAFEY